MQHYLLKERPMQQQWHHRMMTLLILILMISNGVYSQDKRPKIGLVLSGGGAKGLAHIGVIKEMERAGLRPDYITGTSMGSVVGGLYAMGYSPQDLEDIVNLVDWDEVLTNKIPLSEITIEEKPYYNRYIAEVPLSSPFKVSFPPGIIEGQKLIELLLDLTRPVHDVEDFNQLPIPFACVATDISTGRAVILNKGSLAECMRASMAIPGVFTPVEIDGKLLVDGGLTRNFPVQEVIDMGADIVIGVFVSDDLKKKEELGNFISILFQSTWVMSSYDTREQKEHVDVYLEPVNTGYGTADFKMSEEIIHQGELIGNEYFPVFKKLADSIYALGPKNTHAKPAAVDSYLINTVDISGNKRIPAELIRRKLAIKQKSVVTSREIERKVTLLFGTQHFNSVGYHLLKVDSGYNLIINTKEAPPGKLKGAVHYDSENKAGININYTLRNVLFPNSRAVVEVDLAEYPRVDINYLKYIREQQDLAAMIKGEFNSFRLRIEEGETRGDYHLNQYAITGNLFTTAATNHSYGISLSSLFVSMRPEVGPQFDYIRNNSLNVQTWYQQNKFERPFYPRRGSKAWASLSSFFNTSVSYKVTNDTASFTDDASAPHTFRTDFSYTRILPLHRSVVIVGEARMAFSTTDEQSNLVAIGNSYFGGFRPRIRDSHAFYGAYSFEYSSYDYVLMKVDIQTEILPKLFLNTGVNFISIEYPMAWFHSDYTPSGDLRDGKHWRLGYGASLGYLSVIGPISITGAIDQTRRTIIGNFALGFYF